MKVIFAGGDRNSVRLISGGVKRCGDEHVFFSGVRDFLADFDSCARDADILVFDYRLAWSCEVRLFGKLRADSRSVPFVFYNDPFAFGRNRVLYWVHRNENFFGRHTFDYLIPFLTSLDGVLNERGVRSALCADEFVVEERACRVATLDGRGPLPPALSKIFAHFCRNAGREVSVRELRGLDGDLSSESTVYSYISRLRKIMRSENRFRIVRTGKGRYALYELSGAERGVLPERRAAFQSSCL